MNRGIPLRRKIPRDIVLELEVLKPFVWDRSSKYAAGDVYAVKLSALMDVKYYRKLRQMYKSHRFSKTDEADYFFRIRRGMDEVPYCEAQGARLPAWCSE